MIKNNLRTALFIVAAAFVSFVCNVLIASDNTKSPQQQYIYKYSALAIEEMYRSGVPASITLAQGLLESRYGLSALAVDGNNHFGIKCHNWAGRKMYHDDDKKGECFRKYDSPEESFRDHSDFLRYRDRYKFLFDLEVNDYEGWAHGLKKAGYATDPAYPTKLIKLIKDYELYKYDVAPSDYGSFELDDVEEYVFVEKKTAEKKHQAEKHPADHDKAKKAKKKEKAHEKNHEKEKEKPRHIPESPIKAETVKLIEKKPDGEFSFNLTRQMYSQNGVPFVYSTNGETYASIAKTFGLFPKEVLKFNDLESTTPLDMKLKPGTIVYVQAKKKEAAKGIEKHVIESDDTLRGIAQRYGVKLDKIYKMNAFDATYVPKEGDIIKLRN